MKQDPIASGKRKPVNLSLDTGVVAMAREAGLNLSQISEAAIALEARKARDRQWKEKNRDTIEGWNRWIEINGLPLEKYRVF
jgi:antitoxin CcdA